MGKISKHLIFLYLTLIFILILNMASKVVLNQNFSIFDHVPSESDLVLEVNTKNLFKEVIYQKIYNSVKIETDEYEEEYNTFQNSGINFFSKLVVFREHWANEPVWFMLISIDNQKKFETFSKDFMQYNTVTFFKNYALLQLNAVNDSIQNQVDSHIENIKNRKVKSARSKPMIADNFSNDNEINIYLKMSKSEFITDGYFNINFFIDHIKVLGQFTPVAKSTPVLAIKHSLKPDKAFSLRSSLNLFNTLYLFNDVKLEKLPDYSHLSFDYDGATLLTVNEEIPIHTYPNLSLNLGINNPDEWQKYLDRMVKVRKLQINGDTLMIDSGTKTFMKYNISNDAFNLLQEPINYDNNTDSTLFFNLSVQPSKLIAKTFFKKDEKNPPKMFANLKIGVIQSIIEDFNYLNAIQSIDFSITRINSESDYKSEGQVIYKAENSHSIVESFIISKEFMATFGKILEIY